MITVTISAAVYGLCLGVAAVKDIRYYLKGVHVERAADAPGGVIVVATDGHRMLVIAQNSGVISGGESAILPRVKVPAKAHELVFDGVDCTVFDANGARMAVLPATYIDGKFPEWRKTTPVPVVPDDAAVDWTAPNEDPAFFNPKLLAGFVKVAITLRGGRADYNNTMRIRSGGKSGVMVVDFGGDLQAYGLIMPMRQDGPEWHGVPAWGRPANPPAPVTGENPPE